MPVRTYSSGMFMRLGFSVAMHVHPDVLLLDEVLAVGDEAFQQKCFGRIWDFKRAGGTIVFVSHDAERRWSASATARCCWSTARSSTGPAGGGLPHLPPAADEPHSHRRRRAPRPPDRSRGDHDGARLRHRRHLARAVRRGRADAVRGARRVRRAGGRHAPDDRAGGGRRAPDRRADPQRRRRRRRSRGGRPPAPGRPAAARGGLPGRRDAGQPRR